MSALCAICSEIELTGEAMEVIGDYYATLRSRADDSALPITVRTLETVIRLSTAAAKARLAKGGQPLYPVSWPFHLTLGPCFPNTLTLGRLTF